MRATVYHYRLRVYSSSDTEERGSQRSRGYHPAGAGCAMPAVETARPASRRIRQDPFTSWPTTDLPRAPAEKPTRRSRLSIPNRKLGDYVVVGADEAYPSGPTDESRPNATTVQSKRMSRESRREYRAGIRQPGGRISALTASARSAAFGVVETRSFALACRRL